MGENSASLEDFCKERGGIAKESMR